MRKLISLSAGLALASTVLLAIPASADPAIVVRPDEPCGMPGADAGGGLIFGGLGTVTHVVENSNHVIMKCKSSDLVNDSGRGQEYSGHSCGVELPSGSFVMTEESHASVSKNGRGTITCKVSLKD